MEPGVFIKTIMIVLIGVVVGAFLGLIFDYVDSTKNLALATDLTGRRVVGGAIIGVALVLAPPLIARVRSRHKGRLRDRDSDVC